MLKTLFDIMMLFSSIAWIVSVYIVKSEIYFLNNSSVLTAFFMGVLPIIIQYIGMILLPKEGKEEIKNCIECDLVDGNYISMYLGYFFVALSIPSYFTLCFVIIILSIMLWKSRAYFFNPVLLLLNYHFYSVVTEGNTHIFIIKKGKITRNAKYMNAKNLYRISDTSFIEIRRD